MSETHFGFQTVDEREKVGRVRGVFDSVASRYDVMNDLMSLGLHRAWKAYTVAVAALREGDRVLDIAGGTGDLARAFARKVGSRGMVVLTDINEAMLRPWPRPPARRRPGAADRAVRRRGPAVRRGQLRRGERRLRPAQHDAQGPRAGRDAARAAPGRAPAGARVLEGRRAAGQGLRLVLVQGAAADRQARRRRRRQLPLPGRVDPRAPRPGRR